jgi:hypothetical protein
MFARRIFTGKPGYFIPVLGNLVGEISDILKIEWQPKGKGLHLPVDVNQQRRGVNRGGMTEANNEEKVPSGEPAKVPKADIAKSI